MLVEDLHQLERKERVAQLTRDVIQSRVPSATPTVSKLRAVKPTSSPPPQH